MFIPLPVCYESHAFSVATLPVARG